MGGQHSAVESMKNFYKSKFSRPPGETDVSPAQIAALKDKHAVDVYPITTEEVSEALARTRPNTSSGNDAVCYTAIKTFSLMIWKANL